MVEYVGANDVEYGQLTIFFQNNNNRVTLQGDTVFTKHLEPAQSYKAITAMMWFISGLGE